MEVAPLKGALASVDLGSSRPEPQQAIVQRHGYPPLSTRRLLLISWDRLAEMRGGCSGHQSCEKSVGTVVVVRQLRPLVGGQNQPRPLATKGCQAPLQPLAVGRPFVPLMREFPGPQCGGWVDLDDAASPRPINGAQESCGSHRRVGDPVSRHTQRPSPASITEHTVGRPIGQLMRTSRPKWLADGVAAHSLDEAGRPPEGHIYTDLVCRLLDQPLELIIRNPRLDLEDGGLPHLPLKTTGGSPLRLAGHVDAQGDHPMRTLPRRA